MQRCNYPCHLKQEFIKGIFVLFFFIHFNTCTMHIKEHGTYKVIIIKSLKCAKINGLFTYTSMHSGHAIIAIDIVNIKN